MGGAFIDGTMGGAFIVGAMDGAFIDGAMGGGASIDGAMGLILTLTQIQLFFVTHLKLTTSPTSENMSFSCSSVAS